MKPKVFTNNPSKKISKYGKEQMLREFKYQRAKGTEEWNKNQKRKTVGSKYKKNEVIFFKLQFRVSERMNCKQSALYLKSA